MKNRTLQAKLKVPAEKERISPTTKTTKKIRVKARSSFEDA
jgi:hypothetical protein